MVDVVGDSQPSPRGCHRELTSVVQRAEMGWWVWWVFSSFVLRGSGALVPPDAMLVVENCLSRNLTLSENKKKMGIKNSCFVFDIRLGSDKLSIYIYMPTTVHSRNVAFVWHELPHVLNVYINKCYL